MRGKVKLLIDKGFFHIFASNVINKVIQFSSGVFLVRLLSKEQYGLYSYTQNLLMFFVIFNGLGMLEGMLQFGSETADDSKRLSIFRYGIKIGVGFNILVSIVILLSAAYLPLEFENARPILKAMFILPLMRFILEVFPIYFRTILENKKFSLLSNISTALTFVFSVLGAYYFEVIGVIAFGYIALLLAIAMGLRFIGSKVVDIIKAKSLSEKLKKEFLKYSIASSFNNAISQMLYVIDIFLIGIFISDELIIASYKTSTLIPFALNFIPISIMIFIYPYFSRSNSNKEWIKENYIRLTKYLFLLNALISMILFVFAPLIIKLLFGSQYLDSVGSFRVLAIGYFFAATFRIPVGNILNMLRKVKFGLYLSIITGTLNIVLDIVLIKIYGAIGAAYATLIVYIFTSVIGTLYLNYVLKQKII